MTTSDAGDEHDSAAPQRRWWQFWRWSPGPYRSRADRLSAEGQGDASSFWLRGGR